MEVKRSKVTEDIYKDYTNNKRLYVLGWIRGIRGNWDAVKWQKCLWVV